MSSYTIVCISETYTIMAVASSADSRLPTFRKIKSALKNQKKITTLSSLSHLTKILHKTTTTTTTIRILKQIQQEIRKHEIYNINLDSSFASRGRENVRRLLLQTRRQKIFKLYRVPSSLVHLMSKLLLRCRCARLWIPWV